MAITNQERVGKAMELLRAGLSPFVEREFNNVHQAQASEAMCRYFGKNMSVAGMVEAGILELKRGKVRLLQPDELPADRDRAADMRVTAWEIVRLAHEGGTPMAEQGGLFGDTGERSDS